MLRQLHSLLGISAGLLVGLLVLTAVALSIYPTLERFNTTVMGTSHVSVAELASKAIKHQPGVEELQRTPAGAVVIYYSDKNNMGTAIIDPITGVAIAKPTSSPIKSWLKKFHRSYLLDTPGRIATAVGALVMLLLGLTGLYLLANRAGGWRYICHKPQGNWQQRLHIQTALIAVLGLTISATTGLYMSADTFSLLPPMNSPDPMPPSFLSTGVSADVGTLPALKNIPLADLRELVFPHSFMENQVYYIRTNHGAGIIAADTGAMLVFEPYNLWQQSFELIYQLHTGDGLWWFALLLGASALAMPLLFCTGIIIWWQRRRGRVRIRANITSQLADTIILVGSENNNTWGFANHLHKALTKEGYQVHTAAMNSLVNYPKAQRLFILAATYGNGEPPSSAKLFLNRLEKLTVKAPIPYAVLGFGDRQFPQYCAYAKSVAVALQHKGWPELLPPVFIDRQRQFWFLNQLQN